MERVVDSRQENVSNAGMLDFDEWRLMVNLRQFMRKQASHGCAVVKGILFIGFSVQIVFGMVWMCCSFFRVQDFEEADSALYQWIYGMTGESPCVMYVLQLLCAFSAGYYFLERLNPIEEKKESFRTKAFGVWRGLALLTAPFAMQCHLALLPHSFNASLFLMMLSLLLEIPRLLQKRPGGKKEWKRVWGRLALAAACFGLMFILSGAADRGSRGETSKGGFAAAMASRMAWPTIWNDFGAWTEDLQEITRDVIWEASFCPGNMKILQDAIESSVGAEGAEEYDWQIARVGWQNHSYMVIRQIGWDALGYLVSPIIFQLQLEGEAYDSCTGRNYEIMRGNSPLLTRYYVDYGCWWFACCLALALCLAALQAVGRGGILWKQAVISTGICVVPVGMLVFWYTMRGAGLMDYKYTTAADLLWLCWGLWLMGRQGSGSRL